MDALIPDEKGEDRASVEDVPMDQIKSNPYQPRTNFDEAGLKELASSIAEHGVIQPILVTTSPDGYTIIAGERRFKAAQMVGVDTIPAIVKEVDNESQIKVALVENLQREDLNPIEEATAYKSLIDEFGFTQEKIAKTLGKSRSAVANTLRLLTLPEDIQKDLAAGDISMGQARSLLAIDDEEKQKQMAYRIKEEKATVREVEQQVSQIKKEQKTGKSSGTAGASGKTQESSEDNIYIKDLKEELQMYLGTKVKVNHKKNRGVIEIEYFGEDDLDRLKNVIMGKHDHY